MPKLPLHDRATLDFSSEAGALLLRAVLLAETNDEIDEEGRVLGEVRASPKVRAAFRASYARADFGGSRSRAGRLINKGAYDQLADHWESALALLGEVRSLFCVSKRAVPTVLSLAHVTAALQTLPAYLKFSQPTLLGPSRLPAEVAVAHKMSAGLFALCKTVLLAKAGEGQDYRRVVLDSRSMYRFAEISGLLLSRTGVEACAAPPRIMWEALATLCEGGQSVSSSAVWILVDRERFRRYADGVISINLWLGVFAAAMDLDFKNKTHQSRGFAFGWTRSQSAPASPVVELLRTLDPDALALYASNSIELIDIIQASVTLDDCVTYKSKLSNILTSEDLRNYCMIKFADLKNRVENALSLDAGLRLSEQAAIEAITGYVRA